MSGRASKGRNDIGGEQGQCEVLACACLHKADCLLHIRHCRIDHYGCSAAGTDAHHEIEDVVGVAVNVEDNHIVAFADGLGQFVQIGWEGGKLADLYALIFRKDT